MMGVQLNEGPSFGMHHGRSGSQNGGVVGGFRGDQIMGGTKMMGVQLDRGPNYGLHRGTWGTQNGGGTLNRSRAKMEAGRKRGEKTKIWSFCFFFFCRNVEKIRGNLQ